jgi:hypothetical protein
VRDVLCRMRGKVMRMLLWRVKKLWTAVEPIMFCSSKLLYEYEATISNKIFSDDRPRRFSDKPEFSETFRISIVRELWLFVLYFVPMQVFHAACLSWQCVRLFHWSSLRKTMKAVRITSVPVDIRSGHLLKTKNCFTRWKVVLLYLRDLFLESWTYWQRQNPTERNLNSSTVKVWKLVFKMFGVW